MEWFCPSVQGEAPSARHSPTFSTMGDSLVLIGGNNDAVSGYHLATFNDVYLFCTTTLTWKRLHLLNPTDVFLVLPYRWCHSAIVINEKTLMYIGGIGIKDTALFSEYYVINLEACTWTRKYISAFPEPTQTYFLSHHEYIIIAQ